MAITDIIIANTPRKLSPRSQLIIYQEFERGAEESRKWYGTGLKNFISLGFLGDPSRSASRHVKTLNAQSRRDSVVRLPGIKMSPSRLSKLLCVLCVVCPFFLGSAGLALFFLVSLWALLPGFGIMFFWGAGVPAHFVSFC